MLLRFAGIAISPIGDHQSPAPRSLRSFAFRNDREIDGGQHSLARRARHAAIAAHRRRLEPRSIVTIKSMAAAVLRMWLRRWVKRSGTSRTPKDTGAVVAHLDDHVPLQSANLQPHMAARLGERSSVRHEVPEHVAGADDRAAGDGDEHRQRRNLNRPRVDTWPEWSRNARGRRAAGNG
jgi:hypothetical protein